MAKCLTCGGNLLYDPLDDCWVCMLCARVQWFGKVAVKPPALLKLVNANELPMP